MPFIIEHSGQIWTSLQTVGRHEYWPPEELFARRPDICKEAQEKYIKKYPKGIAEGTAERNCDCESCLKAWHLYPPHRNEPPQSS